MDSLLEVKIKEIIEEIRNKKMIPIEASARHIHLSKKHLYALFGENYKLNKLKDLSQPGQFLCKERVNLIGTKGVIENVAILGPVRDKTQIEISKTDCIFLGVEAPYRDSGDLENSGDIFVGNRNKIIEIKSGLIIAKRHIHMTPKDAEYFNVIDKQMVKVKVLGERGLTFEKVLVRVSNDSKLAMHIDFDEANACGYVSGLKGLIL